MNTKLKRIPKTVWVLIGIIAAVYAAWSIAYPSGTWRYRMTVVVETPEGIKTGSAVREVSAYRAPGFLGVDARGHAKVEKGEAVVVDLGQRGVLFALMRGTPGGVDYGHWIVFDALPPPSPVDPLSAAGMRYYRSLKNAKATLGLEHYPMFVRFRDLSDPKTVEEVLSVGFCQEKSPDGSCLKDVGFVNTKKMKMQVYTKVNRLEEVFGKGVSFKEVTIEMTDDSVTWGIEKWLPWLPDRKNMRGYLGGSSEPPFNDPTKTYLGGSEFHRGKMWGR